MTTDEDLMREYKSGREEAFNELYRKYSPMVFGFSRKRLRPSEVEDFFQKVWRQLHEKRDLYRDQPFAPWFFSMIKNLLIDEYRKLGKKQIQDERIFQSSSLEEKEMVEDLLRELPKENADLIRRYYLEGHDYQELGHELGVSEASLRQKLSRSLRSLKSMVGGS